MNLKLIELKMKIVSADNLQQWLEKALWCMYTF